MEIILIDDVFELGKRGDVVRVANGYGRNYLIPKKLAVPATPGNRKMVDQQRLAMAKKESKYQEEAELLAQELNQLHLVISRKSGDTGTLFGSVTSKDITDLLQHTGIRLDRRKLLLSQPIKSIGNYRIEIRPHSEVTAEILLSVPIEGEQPISEVKKKDEESDKIVAELEAKLKEMGQLTRGQSSASPQPEETLSDERESQAAEEEEKEATTGKEEKEAAAVEPEKEATTGKKEKEAAAVEPEKEATTGKKEKRSSSSRTREGSNYREKRKRSSSSRTREGSNYREKRKRSSSSRTREGSNYREKRKRSSSSRTREGSNYREKRKRSSSSRTREGSNYREKRKRSSRRHQ